MTTASLRRRIRDFWSRHRTLFWMVHSGWALATGIVVVFLARERYGLVPWVVGFLALTWASTLYFGSRSEHEDDGRAESGAPGVGEEVTSYVTRTLYQETLFFLLPLYAHSTIVGSANVAFLALLAVLAVVSCIDLLFDRWLRTRPSFGLLFFATVAFAALNLLLPLLAGLDPRVATPVAALAAVGSAVPLALRAPSTGLWSRIRLTLAGAAILAVGLGVRSLVPAVPLRTEGVTFSSSLDRRSLETGPPLGPRATTAEVGGELYALFEVFAPSAVPARVRIRWDRDGQRIRTSRDVEITAHDWGFRVWDAWGPGPGDVPPGRYRVSIRTTDGRIFGSAELTVAAGENEP